MPISLKNLVGGGNAVEIGEVILMQDQENPIVVVDDMEFLKSGHVLYEEEGDYPEVYEKFQWKTESNLSRWIPISASVTNTIFNCIYAKDIWIATLSNNLLRSIDGIGWDLIPIANGSTFLSYFDNSDLFVLSLQSRGIAFSVDGLSWDTNLMGASISQSVNDLCFANGVWVAVGNSNLFKFSYDLNVWFDVSHDNSESGAYTAVLCENGVWIAAGNKGSILKSLDGITWFHQFLETGGETFRRIVYFKEAWFVITGSGRIFKSLDGDSWELVFAGFGSGTSSDFFQENHLLVAYGVSGNIAITEDGDTWESIHTGSSSTIFNMNEVDGDLVVVGAQGYFARSKDRVNWTTQDIGFDDSFIRFILYENGFGVAGGAHGKLLISPTTPSLGLSTLHQEGQSIQYMRIK